MKKLLFASLLISLATTTLFADQVRVQFSPVTFFGRGTPHTCSETISATFLLDATTGELDKGSMDFTAFGILGDFKDGFFEGLGSDGNVFWHNAAGDIIRLWPDYGCLFSFPCPLDLRKPGVHGIDILLFSKTDFDNPHQYIPVTVTAVRESTPAALLGLGLLGIVALLPRGMRANQQRHDRQLYPE